MISLPPQQALVVLPRVSVVMVVVTNEAVVLAADRGAVYDGPEMAPGVPMMAPDRAKLFVTPAGVAWAIVGKASAALPDGRVSI